MSILLVVMSFIILMVGIFVQIGHESQSTKTAVSWTSIFGFVVFMIFAAKVHFNV